MCPAEGSAVSRERGPHAGGGGEGALRAPANTSRIGPRETGVNLNRTLNAGAAGLESWYVDFELVGDLTDIETIAAGRGIRDLARLRRLYGKGYWRKMKGSARIRLRNGRIRRAEIHWYEAHGIGKKQFSASGTSTRRKTVVTPTFAVCSATRATRHRSSAIRSTLSCPMIRLSGMAIFGC